MHYELKFVPLQAIMTPEEYAQLKAFARQDGALLSLLWIGGFACYIIGTTSPLMGMLSLLLIVGSPFFAASRLRHFRDEARQGAISFLRGYAYTIMTFFYAGLLLAAAIYAYFAFMDNGYLLGKLASTLNSPEGKQLVEAYGLAGQMEANLKELAAMRPIDYAVNMLSINVTTGLLLGVPIAAVARRTVNSQL